MKPLTFDKNFYTRINELELLTEELYSEIYKRLSDEKLSRFLISIYRDDSSIMFEDVVSDTFIKIKSNELTLDEINANYLKDYRNKITKNQHAGLYENTAIYETEEDLQSKVLDQIPCKYKKIIEDINLSEEEFTTLLYLFDKKSIRKYDYDFIRRKDKRGIEYQKLCTMYENILIKVLKKLKGE